MLELPGDCTRLHPIARQELARKLAPNLATAERERDELLQWRERAGSVIRRMRRRYRWASLVASAVTRLQGLSVFHEVLHEDLASALGIDPREPGYLADKVRGELNRLRARVADLEEWQRAMVARLADERLDGYRALGQRAAEAESERDELRAELEQLRDEHNAARFTADEVVEVTADLEVENTSLRARVAELVEWQRATVAKLAEERLDGYRELGQRAADAENERDALRARVAELEGMQSRVWRWVVSTFGEPTAADVSERAMRFTEEALELAQSVGMSDATALRLVDYVWSRPAGEPSQEVGGTMVTLLTLAEQHGLDVLASALTEIARIETPEVIAKCQRHQAEKESQGMASEGLVEVRDANQQYSYQELRALIAHGMMRDPDEAASQARLRALGISPPAKEGETDD